MRKFWVYCYEQVESSEQKADKVIEVRAHSASDAEDRVWRKYGYMYDLVEATAEA